MRLPSLPSCGLPRTIELVAFHGAERLPASRNFLIKASVDFLLNLEPKHILLNKFKIKRSKALASSSLMSKFFEAMIVMHVE